MLRVIAGHAGGLRLQTPKKSPLRPTQDRIRQVIFSSLAAMVPGADVLDLYAGTGAFGIEALSRGAQRAVFVENNKECVDVIKKNLALCRMDGEVIPLDVAVFLRQVKKKSFQIIFADPPYEKIKSSLDHHFLLEAIRPWLAREGVFVWEHFSGQKLENPFGWEFIRHRNYGETGLSFLKLKS
jgi:16S rRNA (guanine966-N2)-methyltransferase